ncbi:MAG: hypothetical protein O7C75_00810 [Verrucomicrobia bacterium]|nr:hypothetical protein [Verrucomicrobiota bacterium]
MKSIHIVLFLSLIALPLFGQDATEKNKEGFKESTVSDFLNSKYKWEEQKEEPGIKEEITNKTPLKTAKLRAAYRQAAIEAHLQPTLPIDDPRENVPEDELGLDTVELREFQVNELYSPLMRMSELKDIDTLDPASGGAFLSDKYFTNFESRYLNRWTIPLIGRSQEQLAKERYRQQQYQNFLGEVSKTIEGLKTLNPELAKELRKEVRDTQQQYKDINLTDDFRFTGPDAKF